VNVNVNVVEGRRIVHVHVHDDDDVHDNESRIIWAEPRVYSSTREGSIPR
jgi:hypothetical protein